MFIFRLFKGSPSVVETFEGLSYTVGSAEAMEIEGIWEPNEQVVVIEGASDNDWNTRTLVLDKGERLFVMNGAGSTIDRVYG